MNHNNTYYVTVLFLKHYCNYGGQPSLKHEQNLNCYHSVQMLPADNQSSILCIK